MRRKKKNLDVHEDTDDQPDQAVVAQDAPTEEGDQELAEELVEEDVLEVVQDSPEPEDVSDDADHADAEDVSVDDQDDDAPDEEDETVALTHEELGALFDARLKEREAVFDAERQALLAERDAALHEKKTAEHRFTLETFYADLKAAYPDLPASFDELAIVDGLMALSQEPAIPMGDDMISPFAWGKLLLTEVAKYAQVPTERLASHAKAPGDVAKDRQAEIQAAIKHKLEANPKLSERLAMKELAGERPDLFPTQ